MYLHALSIISFSGDFFTPERDENVFNDNSDNLFSDKKGLFDDEVSANLWRQKPIKSYKSNNIIPPSIDVPPPIDIVCKHFYFCKAFVFHRFIIIFFFLIYPHFFSNKTQIGDRRSVCRRRLRRRLGHFLVEQHCQKKREGTYCRR